MQMTEYIIQRLSEFGIPLNEVFGRYGEKHRFYHNMDHIDSMIFKARQGANMTDELFLAILFHDIIYNPKATDNEERSAELLWKYYPNDTVKQAILDTKTHQPTNKVSEILCKLDLDILYGDYEQFVKFEHSIFKEYQFVDFKTYTEKRIEILQNFGVNPEFINYVKYRKPNIAVYTGSFNPFHKGHYNILKQAERIFDKVIIARGINPEKSVTASALPEKLQFRQIEQYNGLMTDFIKSLGYDVTLIRGLRNSTDLQYELTQYRFLQDLMPDIKVVSLFCDKHYEHLSSSAIRHLQSFGKDVDYLII